MEAHVGATYAGALSVLKFIIYFRGSTNRKTATAWTASLIYFRKQHIAPRERIIIDDVRKLWKGINNLRDLLAKKSLAHGPTTLFRAEVSKRLIRSPHSKTENLLGVAKGRLGCANSRILRQKRIQF